MSPSMVDARHIVIVRGRKTCSANLDDDDAEVWMSMRLCVPRLRRSMGAWYPMPPCSRRKLSWFSIRTLRRPMTSERKVLENGRMARPLHHPHRTQDESAEPIEGPCGGTSGDRRRSRALADPGSPSLYRIVFRPELHRLPSFDPRHPRHRFDTPTHGARPRLDVLRFGGTIQTGVANHRRKWVHAPRGAFSFIATGDPSYLALKDIGPN